VPEQLSDVIEVESGTPEFSEVLELWRANRKTLGFLPDEGFAQRAEKGTLLGARAGGEIVGYVLFDLPANKVKLVHLCVRSSRRGTGAARTLVAEVSRRYQSRRGIELACRRDYAVADAVWQELGFLPLHEKPGRSQQRLPLTVWVLDHGHPDLFSDVRPDQELAVLDHTIVVDKAKGFAGEGRHSRPLFEDAWVAELVELAVSGEAFVEIHRKDDAAVRKKSLAEAQALQRVRPAKDLWEPLVDVARQAVPKAGTSDHKHLAQAAAASADYFVTRDDGILRGGDALSRDLQLSVLRPEALIKLLDRRRFSDRYEPRVIEATQIRACDASEIPHERLLRAFLHFGRGERKGAFLETLRSHQAVPDRYESLVLIDDEDRPLGLFCRREHGGRLDVALIRVAHGGPLKDALARQLVYLQRQAAAERGLGAVVISDLHPSPAVTLALGAEGFTPSEHGQSCVLQRGLRPAESVLDAGVQDPAARAAALEHEQWPLKVTGAGVRTYIVPIKLTWAMRLFDTGLAEQTLLPRSPALGLNREHVYYRSPRNHRSIAPGARILWYVSGSGPVQREGHIRAVSRVMEVVTDRPRTLYRRFERLGVYSEADVAKAASSAGEVMAIRFVDTELLERPVSKGQLEQMWDKMGETFNPPQCPVLVGERMFRPIYQRASRYAESP
jgi:predicted nucleic acid-binding protein